MTEAKDGFEIMKKKYNPEIGKEFKKRLVATYVIDGTGGGTWQAIFANGTMEIVEGEKEKAAVKFHYGDAETMVKMLKGELDNTHAYTQGLLKIEGSIPVALKVGGFFKQKK